MGCHHDKISYTIRVDEEHRNADAYITCEQCDERFHVLKYAQNRQDLIAAKDAEIERLRKQLDESEKRWNELYEHAPAGVDFL